METLLSGEREKYTQYKEGRKIRIRTVENTQLSKILILNGRY